MAQQIPIYHVAIAIASYISNLMRLYTYSMVPFRGYAQSKVYIYGFAVHSAYG